VEQWSFVGAVEQSREQWDVEGAVDVEGAAYAAGEVFTFEVMWIYIMVFRYRIYIMVFLVIWCFVTEFSAV
jgi:hypothetical protein